MDVASLRVLFTADGDGTVTRAIDNVNNKLETVDGHARRASGALGSMFKVAGGFLLAQGITNAVGGILSMNSNAEQAKVALEVALGSAEKAEATFLRVQKMAAATPFSTQELLDSTLQLESLGLSSEKWLTTIGDTAAGTTKTVDQVTQAVLDASFGEYERLKEFGIQSKVEGDKVTFSYIKNGKQINETVDKNNKEIIQSTLQAIWNDKYAGAMEKQSKTFKGQWSTLKDNAAIAMMGLTDGIFSSLTGILGFVNNVFSLGFTDAIRAIGGDNTPKFLVDLAAGIDGVAASFRAVIEAFQSGRGLKAILDELPESFQAILGPILAVSDALGDMWSAFRSGGIGGFFDVLIEELANIASTTFDVVIDTTVTVIGEIWDLVNRGWQWFVGYSGVGTSPDGTNATASLEPFTTVDVIVEGIVKLTGDLANIADAIERELGLQRTEAQLQKAEQSGYDTADAIIGAVTQGMDRAGTEAGGVEGQPSENQGFFDKVKALLKWEPEMFRDDEPTIIDEWFQYAVGMGHRVRHSIEEGLSNAFLGTETFNMMTGTSTRSGGISGWLDGINKPFEDFNKAFDETVSGLFDGISAPSLPGWMTDFGWITEPIEGLVATLTSLASSIRTAFGEVTSALAGSSQSNAAVAQANKNSLDFSPLDDLGAQGAQFRPAVTKVTIEADSSPFDGVFSGVQSSLDALAADTHVATLDGDNGPFAVKYTEAFGWGETFAAQTWTAIFDIDNGPAAVAYTEAFGWGAAWSGQVFTASFAIDTSGITNAVAIARQAAADIAAVMPHSPAREGPLSEPIEFDWIADKFHATASRMKTEADSTMAALSGAFGASGGRSGGFGVGGMHVGTAYIYPSSGDVQREFTAAMVGEWR